MTTYAQVLIGTRGNFISTNSISDRQVCVYIPGHLVNVCLHHLRQRITGDSAPYLD